MTTLIEIVKENLNLNIQNPETFCKKLLDSFAEEEQEIFIKNFFIYQKYNPITDFVVELGKIYEWLGFSTLGNAKRILVKNFKEDEDYKILLFQVEEQNINASNGIKKIIIKKNINNDEEIKIDNRGGHNKETIMLNVNCFKKLCLKAQTKEADKIHDYYVKLERIIFTHITI